MKTTHSADSKTNRITHTPKTNCPRCGAFNISGRCGCYVQSAQVDINSIHLELPAKKGRARLP